MHPIAPPPPVVKKTSTHRVTKHRRPPRKKVAKHSALRARRPQVQLIPTAASTPSAVGAAFDLGSGPTILFAALLVSAALIALGGGLQRGRR